MHKRQATIFFGTVLAIAAWAWMLALGQPAAAQQAKPGAVTVLDAHSVWRIYSVLKPPVVQLDGGLKAITSHFEWLDKETAAAPEGWDKVMFDDTTWLRGAATAGPKTPYASHLHFRARFEVKDPAEVSDLALSITYYGGAIVYVNGQEIARGNLPKEGKDAALLAEGYPEKAFVNDKGELVTTGWGAHEFPDNVGARDRKLVAGSIPASDLHKGVNVVGIELVRAPYNKIVADYWKRQPKDTREAGDPECPYDFAWGTCEMRDVTLTGNGAGLVANAGRPKELQIWNSDVLVQDTSFDIGDRCEPLRPVSMKAPRNGWSSGKVVLGSAKPIEGLNVTCGELKQGDSVIPASAIRARYGTSMTDPYRDNAPIETLLETPLASFPVGTGRGAVVPIWFTLKVPATAKPGMYTGQAMVELKGEKPIPVTLNVDVSDFTMPDSQDYHAWIELMESPDTLAAEYKVPLWSDAHFELMREAMRYIGEIGSRVAYVPLIAQTNSGNSESMVRWIKKPNGTYDYDFSIMDRYLDMVEKTMGKPKFVVFTVWEIYLNTPKEEVKIAPTDSDYISMEKSWAAARWDLRGKGPAITVLDPGTKETSLSYLPRFEDAAAKPAWKPLFDELHRRMAKRGLEKTMLLGMASDYWPSKEEITTIQDVSGNLEWINHTHQGPMGAKMGGLGTVAYTAYVWPVRYANDPPKNAAEAKDPKTARMYGWKRPELVTEFRRFTGLNDWPLATMMLLSEIEITGKQRGLGRIGADFWPVVKDKHGERRGWIWDKYPQSKWHSCNLSSHMLDPGPTGPVATARYEMLREGMQIAEARITIEAALTNDQFKARLGADLANRCQQLLDERLWEQLKTFSDLQLTGRNYSASKNGWGYGCGGDAGQAWYAGQDWQDRTMKLYALAGEVKRTLGER